MVDPNLLCTFREFVLSAHAMHRSLDEFRETVKKKAPEVVASLGFDRGVSGAIDLKEMLDLVIQIDPHDVDADAMSAFFEVI